MGFAIPHNYVHIVDAFQGRVGELHELVKTVLYLASPSAGFITGQVLAIDGAYTQTLYEPPV